MPGKSYRCGMDQLYNGIIRVPKKINLQTAMRNDLCIATFALVRLESEASGNSSKEKLVGKGMRQINRNRGSTFTECLNMAARW